MRSSVLINEPPILVLPTLASEIGLNEAMVLQQIHYWLNNDRIKNHFNGQTWVRNTYDQWRRQFPFWGEKTLRRAFSSLEEQQLVQSFISNEEFRKTKFYTIQYDNVEKLDLGHRPYIREKTPTASSIRGLASGQNDQIDQVKMTPKTSESQIRGSASGQNDQTDQVKMTRSYKEAETTFRENIIPPPTPPNSRNAKREEDEDLYQIRFKGTATSHTSSVPKGQTDSSTQADTTGQNDQMEYDLDPPVNLDGSNFNQFLSARPSGHFDQIEGPKRTDAFAQPGDRGSKSVDEEEELSVRMIRVWNQLVQSKIKDAARKELVLTEARRQALGGLFEGVLNHDFAEWERYCEQISHIRFLLGHGPRGFKVSLDWATEPDNALKVLEGRIYDRPVETDAVEEKPHNELASEIQELFATKGFSEEWLPIYLFLAERQGQAFYRSWLKACEPQPVVDGKGVLFASTTFARDHMTSQYLSDIQQAARHFWKQNVEIIIEVKK